MRLPGSPIMGLGGSQLQMLFRAFSGQPTKVGDQYRYGPHGSAFLGLPYRILSMNPEKELLWGLWVAVGLHPSLKMGLGFSQLPFHFASCIQGACER